MSLACAALGTSESFRKRQSSMMCINHRRATCVTNVDIPRSQFRIKLELNHLFLCHYGEFDVLGPTLKTTTYNHDTSNLMILRPTLISHTSE